MKCCVKERQKAELGETNIGPLMKTIQGAAVHISTLLAQAGLYFW